MKKKHIILLAIIVVFASIGCLNQSEKNYEVTDNIEEKTTTKVEENKDVLVISIGTIERDAAKYIQRYQPIIDYVAEKLSDQKTKYTGKVIIVDTMDKMVTMLKEQKLDLYAESPFTTRLISKETEAVPFIRRWKGGSGEYKSVYFVKKDSTINSIEDFKDKIIAFESEQSTSGYLLPKSYLIDKGHCVSAETTKGCVQYVFAGEDENTGLWVFEGKADIGGTSNLDFEGYPEDMTSNFKIVGETMNVPRHVISHRSDLDPALVEKIKQILVGMEADPEAAETLKTFKKTKKFDEIPDKETLFETIDRLLNLLE